jgi:hypothetical protein
MKAGGGVFGPKDITDPFKGTTPKRQVGGGTQPGVTLSVSLTVSSARCGSGFKAQHNKQPRRPDRRQVDRIGRQRRRWFAPLETARVTSCGAPRLLASPRHDASHRAPGAAGCRAPTTTADDATRQHAECASFLDDATTQPQGVKRARSRLAKPREDKCYPPPALVERCASAPPKQSSQT